MKAASWMGRYSLLLGNEPPLKGRDALFWLQRPPVQGSPPNRASQPQEDREQDPWWRQEHRLVTPGGQGPVRVTWALSAGAEGTLEAEAWRETQGWGAAGWVPTNSCP